MSHFPLLPALPPGDAPAPGVPQPATSRRPTRAELAQRQHALAAAMRAQFGEQVALPPAFVENQRWVLPCARHPGKQVRLGALYPRLAQGKLLCSQCEALTPQGRAARQEAGARRVRAVTAASAAKWRTEVLPLLLQACERLGMALAPGHALAPGRAGQFLCHAHREHGSFTVRLPRQLLQATHTACPHCSHERRMMQPWQRWAADPVLRETVYRVRRGGSAWARDGGYLYRIVDAASTRQYIGLTTLSLEVRWEGHLRDAREKDRPLYRAMRERPGDFHIEAIAFFRTRECLRQAERDWVRQEDTLWPNGYNVSRGGEAAGACADGDIRAYAIRHALDAAQVATLLDWAQWTPALGLSRGGLYHRLAADMPYAELTTRPVPQDRPVVLGSVTHASQREAAAALGLELANVAPQASEAGITVAQMLEFIGHLRSACGPWRCERWVGGSLDELRQQVNVSLVRLWREWAGHDGCVAAALARLAEAAGERIEGVLHLSRQQACAAHGVKLPTVLGRMQREGEPFAAALLACAGDAQARLHGRRTATRWRGEFEFRGVAYPNPTRAAQALGIRDNTFSYWRARFADPAQALEACLRLREGGAVRAKVPLGALKVQVRGVTYASLRAAAQALQLSESVLKATVARPGFCRETALEYLLRKREGRADARLDAVRQALGMDTLPSLPDASEQDRAWLAALHAAVRCARRAELPSSGLRQWLEREAAGAHSLPPALAQAWGQAASELAPWLAGLPATRVRAARPAKAPGELPARDEAALHALRDLQARTGSVRVPDAPEWAPLGSWVAAVRRAHARGQLAPALRARLEPLDFDFSRKSDAWWCAYGELKAFAAAHGHCNVSRELHAAHARLADWVTRQRQLRRKQGAAAFSPAQLEALAAIGFVWDMRELWWSRGVVLLHAFIAEHGHGYVPEVDIGQPAELASFCASVRKARRQGYLAAEKEQALSAAGFVWEAGVKGQKPGVRYVRRMGRKTREERATALQEC